MFVIDSREPPSIKRLVAQTIGEAFSGTELDVRALSSGDYLLEDKDGCVLGIERKTWSDLLGSITDGRVFRQLERLDRECNFGVLLIEGRAELSRAGQSMRDGGVARGGRFVLGGLESNYTHAFVQMTLFSLQRASGLAVLHTGELAESVDLLRIIYDRGLRECYGVSTRKVRPSKVRVKGRGHARISVASTN